MEKPLRGVDANCVCWDMRAALCLLVSSGCAQVLGLDPPAALQVGDASIADAGQGSDGATTARCKGDNFDDNALSPGLWTRFTEAGSAVTETNQQLVLSIDASTGSAYCGVDAETSLAATDTGVQLEVVTPSPDNATEVALVLRLDNGDQLIFGKDETRLSARVRSGGLVESHDELWVANVHRFLRIEREADKTITFSTSPDGTTWTVSWSKIASFALESLTPQIYAGHYMAVAAADVAVDNFVVLTANCAP